MDTINTPLPSFQNACALIELGNAPLIHGILQQETCSYTALEQTYLRAWIACECAQSLEDLNEDEKEAYWHEAANALETSSASLLGAGVKGASPYFSTKRQGTLRRQRPWTRWLLGNLATHLGCPSVEHYTQAIRLLDERRMNIAWLRIQVLCDQAQLVLIQAPRTALVLYDQALRLCEEAPQEGESAHEALPAIYTGLCETHEQLANYERALVYGMFALDGVLDEQAKVPLLSRLGQVHAALNDTASAFTAYQEALALAESAAQRITIRIALARLYLHAQDFPHARQTCVQALAEGRENVAKGVNRDLYYTCGEIAHAQAQAATWAKEPQRARLLAEESVAWYVEALSSVPRSSSVLNALAQLLEELLELDSQVIHVQFWREAHRLLFHHIEPASGREPRRL